MFFVLMFIDINHIILFILNTWFCWLKTFNQNPDFLRRNFAPKRVVMVKPSACDIVAVADAARPQRSTPYFSVSQQQIAYRKGKKSKTIRAWRRSGSRTTLLSTLLSNDWLGPGTVWTFYYFDAIFLLLQGSRIDGVDK